MAIGNSRVTVCVPRFMYTYLHLSTIGSIRRPNVFESSAKSNDRLFTLIFKIVSENHSPPQRLSDSTGENTWKDILYIFFYFINF